MSKHYANKADGVVDAFKGLIGEELANTLGETHLNELSMMIESTISTSVLEELELIGDKVENLAHEVRKHTDRYD